MISHADFAAACEASFWTVLLDLPGFLHCRIAQDSLHGLNLGPAGIYTAGCLWYMVLNSKSRDVPIAKRLQLYWERFQVWKKQNKLVGVSIPVFDRSMLGKAKNVHKSCPEFKIKAHQVRVVAAWLNDELNSELEDEDLCSVLHAPMAVGMFALASFYFNMDTMPRLLSEEQADEMAQNLETCLLAHLTPTLTCQLEMGLLLFDIRPKFHHMAHMVKDIRSERQNPKFCWCFGDED